MEKLHVLFILVVWKILLQNCISLEAYELFGCAGMIRFLYSNFFFPVLEILEGT